MKYAIKIKVGFGRFDLISSRDVVAKWPQELIAYLASQIVFKAPTRMVSFLDEVELNQNNIIGQPTNILGLYFFYFIFKS